MSQMKKDNESDDQDIPTQVQNVVSDIQKEILSFGFGDFKN